MGSGQTTFMSSAGNRKQRISVFSVAFLLSLKRVSAETGVFRDRNLLVHLLSSELDAIVIDLYVHASLRSQFAMPTGSQPSAATSPKEMLLSRRSPYTSKSKSFRFRVSSTRPSFDLYVHGSLLRAKQPVPAALYICCWDRLINSSCGATRLDAILRPLCHT